MQVDGAATGNRILRQVTAKLRKRAEEIFRAGVAAADPQRATGDALRELDLRPPVGGRPAVFAIGKAAFGMSEAAAVALGDAARSSAAVRSVGAASPFDVLLVTHDEALPSREFEATVARGVFSSTAHDAVEECGQSLPSKASSPITVLRSGHPLPDERGLAAARRIERRAAALGADDLALVLISGGASALLPAPATGVRLEDKLEATRLLLGSGATIHELNAVRKHLSTIKGGGLLRQLRPARVVTLALSDVIDDDPSVIGSGPTAPDPSTFEDAHAALARCGLLQTCPTRVRARIETGLRGELDETLKPDDPLCNQAIYRIVGGNRTSVRAMGTACGEGVEVEPAPLEGEACEVGARLARLLATTAMRAWVAGGETTVTVRGNGTGGRNQELALAFALEATKGPLANRPDWVFLAAGTDGRDGPTDAAGGIVDASTVARMQNAGVDPSAALADNDSYRALQAADALLHTGATGTNVADVAVFLRDA